MAKETLGCGKNGPRTRKIYWDTEVFGELSSYRGAFFFNRLPKDQKRLPERNINISLTHTFKPPKSLETGGLENINGLLFNFSFIIILSLSFIIFYD